MNLLITMLSQISLDTNSQDQIPKFEIDMPLWLFCIALTLNDVGFLVS